MRSGEQFGRGISPMDASLDEVKQIASFALVLSIAGCAPVGAPAASSPTRVPATTAATTAGATPLATSPAPTAAATPQGTPVPLPTITELSSPSANVVWALVGGSRLFKSV